MNKKENDYFVNETIKLHYKGFSFEQISETLKMPKSIVELIIFFNCD